MSDRYFGLGDKTGPLDKHGRRLRTLAARRASATTRRRRILYTSTWPFLLGRDDDSGIGLRALLRHARAPRTFDLGCEYDNYHGFYRYAEIDDGDLDYYLFVGPRIRDVVRKFTELTGRMAFGPRWSLGYANTAMSSRGCARCAGAVGGIRGPACRARHSRFPRFTSARGTRASASAATCSRGTATSFPIRTGRSAKFKRAERARRRQSRSHACSTIIRRTRGRRARRVRQRRQDGEAVRRTVLGRVRRARRLHASRRHAVVAGEVCGVKCCDLRDRRRLERQQRVRDLGRLRRVARISAPRCPSSGRGRCTRC